AERKWALPTVARGLGGVAPIGDGNCESSFLANKAKTAQHGISEITIFTGMVSNIYDYFQAVDVLLIPSFHEGFPVIAIEAQASSLPVILSDTISAEGKISELAHFESLKSGASAWAKKVLEIKNSVQERTAIDLSHSGFHIKTEAEKLQRILKK
ncbi:MAG: glycosyltransferase, partial [Defluviitaleaceae bacterium]|nr:glycosyltransferase [Defluviitaleaceae bacterium]